ncbi:MAG: VOC family protein, partial [Terriglobales bacterium]
MARASSKNKTRKTSAKSAARKSTKPRAAKKAAKPPVRTAKKSPPAKKPAAPELPADYGEKLTFNHAMIYAKDVARSLAFYRDLMGFKVIEDFRHEGISVYARLRAPGGDGTIAIHMAGPGTSRASDGVRLYVEI